MSGSLPDGPVIGFRSWRLHAGRLWPVRPNARTPWPDADVPAGYEPSPSSQPTGRHLTPAPGGCGLWAFHELGSVKDLYADVWGGVLAWGRIEIGPTGFRSQWQRPVALAPAPRTPPRPEPHQLARSPAVGGWRHEELDAAAARYGARVVGVGQLEAVARAIAAPVPVDLVPVVPLLVLVHPAAWWHAPDGRERPPITNPTVARFDGAALVRQIHEGGVLARAFLAAHAADLATSAALTGGDRDAQLVRLQTALLGVLMAVETWQPRAVLLRGDSGISVFRAHAAEWIDSVLREAPQRPDRGFPDVLTYGEVRRLATLQPPGLTPPRRMGRRRAPLTGRQLVWLVSAGAQRAPGAGYLTDSLMR
ncbi:MAG: hypothetical protein ACLP50_33955 [Solirubrobacteraceae bacterium]